MRTSVRTVAASYREALSCLQVAGWQTARPALCQPPLNYVAPEFIINKHVSRCSDLFSLGMLTYAMYNSGRILCDHGNTVTQYTRNIEWVSCQNEV